MSQFCPVGQKVDAVQHTHYFYTYLSFIEQDIRYDVWQTPCNNEDRILVCIGQLTNLEKDTKIKTKTDHWHNLSYMKFNN